MRFSSSFRLSKLSVPLIKTPKSRTNAIVRQPKNLRPFKIAGIGIMTSYSFSDQLHSIEEVSKEYDLESELMVIVDDNDDCSVMLADVVSSFSMENHSNVKNGLQHLLDTMAERKSENLVLRNMISYAIVYGGHEETCREERFRCCIQNLLCSTKGAYDNDLDGSSSFFFEEEQMPLDNNHIDCSDEDVEEQQKLRDENDILSLQLICKSLHHILDSQLSLEESFNFHDPFWIQVIGAIIDNIEMAYHNEVVGYSLKCLRLLHCLEPVIVQQLLHLSLMPYLVHLKEYGASQKVPLIESEASRLLQNAEI